MTDRFSLRYNRIQKEYENLISRRNVAVEPGDGLYQRYRYPILTAAHTPVFWRYDCNPATNPFFIERIGVNATFNAGAIKIGEKYILAVRVEGNDRKSFFALAESTSGTEGFIFREYPLRLPQTDTPETNVYDMRLTRHVDGWIYGIFCAERKDPDSHEGDFSSAVTSTGIVRTKDFENWERLPDLVSESRQRDVVLHPEFINGTYALYTRPQDGFIETGSGGGIGWALVHDMASARVTDEKIVDMRANHTVKEMKNGEGPPPLKTPSGWLHLAHGIWQCAAGLRYVLYLFLTDLSEPWKVIAEPAGYFMAPEGEEKTGGVPNVLFSNGWIADDDGTVYIYYASSDTRMHVATSRIDILTDYCVNTPRDALTSDHSVEVRCDLITRNLDFLIGQI